MILTLTGTDISRQSILIESDEIVSVRSANDILGSSNISVRGGTIIQVTESIDEIRVLLENLNNESGAR